MGVLQPFKKGFGVATQSLGLIFVLFIFGTIWNLVNVFMAPQLPASPDQTVAPTVSAAMIVTGVVFILLSFFVQAGSLGYVRERVKLGRAGLSDFFGNGGKYYVPLFLLGLLIALIVGVFILLAGLAIFLFSKNLNIVGVILAVAIAATGIYFMILMFLAPYFIVAGEEKVIASIKKSISLVRKHILAVIGIAFLLILVGFLFGVVLGVILALLSAAIQGVVSQVIFAVLSSLVNAFLGIWVTGAFMVFYLGANNPSNTSGAVTQA